MTRQRPILDQLDVVVRDMEAAVAFYRTLGVEVSDPAPPWDAHHRETVTTGDMVFHLDSLEHTRQWDRGWSGSGNGAGCVVGFKFATREDVDAVYADLTGAGYHGQQEPYDAFWGARYAVVEDPDANPVGLMSPSDPARRSAPPDL